MCLEEIFHCVWPMSEMLHLQHKSVLNMYTFIRVSARYIPLNWWTLTVGVVRLAKGVRHIGPGKGT
jgi:hypothetical protein